jgi:hypothetical protein
MVTLVTQALNQYENVTIPPGWHQAFSFSFYTVGAWRHYGAVAMTCELGMLVHYTNLPNPAAFPTCCLVVSEIDAAAGRPGGDTVYRCSLIIGFRVLGLGSRV